MPEKDVETLHGVQFAPTEGRRSSSAVGKAVFSDAVSAVDPTLARHISSIKDWRKRYMAPVRDVVVAGVASPKDALRIAADGLDALHRNLTFASDGDDQSLRAALATDNEEIETQSIPSAGSHPGALKVPYRGEELYDDALLRRLEDWERDNVIHASCAAAVAKVVRSPEWLDLADRTFVLLGAASQMGPVEHLLAWGAHVVAVDLPRPALWEHVLDRNRQGSGRLTVPLRGNVEDRDDVAGRAGVDLIADLPAVATWLQGLEGPYTIGNYVYADGATFVRVAAGVDALIAQIVEQRKDVSLAYLATPTDVYAVPSDVVDNARAGRSHGLARSTASVLTRGNLYRPNYQETLSCEDGSEWGISDCLVPIQGPNYALAKSLQRWRAMMAREEGRLSSANVAPATRTTSVTKNKMLAAAYRGAGAFGVEIFEPETSSALMAALLVHDLRDESSSARPETPLDHPYRLFSEGAAHGGIWNLGHEPRTVLPLALLRGAIGRS
ncbi:MAG: hypothetical protein M3277_02165 [Actinomycetota bacterium]|nr:hypothetical protein [Actinomycetota bacterium]